MKDEDIKEMTFLETKDVLALKQRFSKPGQRVCKIIFAFLL
jgi:hypothetical protein